MVTFDLDLSAQCLWLWYNEHVERRPASEARSNTLTSSDDTGSLNKKDNTGVNTVLNTGVNTGVNQATTQSQTLPAAARRRLISLILRVGGSDLTPKSSLVRKYGIIGTFNVRFKFYMCCFTSKLEPNASKAKIRPRREIFDHSEGDGLTKCLEPERRSIIFAKRGTISSSVLKPECVKGDWCRKSSQNFAHFDIRKI